MGLIDGIEWSPYNAVQAEVLQGILIPFLGTFLGAACVLFMKDTLNILLQRILTGFAAGVMVAASIWSLLVPEMDGNFVFAVFRQSNSSSASGKQ